jgi:hypothetical protein
MKNLLLALLILPYFALANIVKSIEPACVHGNKPLKVGESVWVVDPLLVKKTADIMHSKGYTEDVIAKEVSRNDWVGYRLICVRTFKASEGVDFKQPGDVLLSTGVALVLNEYSDDFYQFVLENNSPSTSF